MKTSQIALALAAFSIATPCTLSWGEEPAKPAAPAEEAAKALQGTWEGVEVGREGAGKCTLTISGNTLHFQGAVPAEWYKGTFELPAGTDPKQLLGLVKECPFEQAIGKTAIAIYKIEDGKLTLVGHPPGAPEAPRGFEGDELSRTFTLTKVPAK